jgi:hypothetical protein
LVVDATAEKIDAAVARLAAYAGEISDELPMSQEVLHCAAVNTVGAERLHDVREKRLELPFCTGT